jgi:hypothetical protein
MVAGPLETLKEPTMTKLTDTQLIVLGKACERTDGAVYPVTTKLNGGALAKVLNSLIAKDLIKEVRAKRDETVWRRDDEERPLTLYATHAAYTALGIEQDERSHEEGTTKARKPQTRVAKGGKTTKDTPIRTHADSKQAQLIAMLKSPQGATIDEIAAAFDWRHHTVRGVLAGALKKKLGLEVTSEKVEARGRVYRLPA